MRHLTRVTAVLLVMALIAPAAQAKEYEHFKFPRNVDQGAVARLKVWDCESGPGFTAFIEVKFLNDASEKVYKKVVPADADGVTKLRIKIREDRFVVPFGQLFATHRIQVRCLHRWPDGSQGVWWKKRAKVKVWLAEI